jgi:thymidylate synthase
MFSIVVAIDQNNSIGKDGKIPWHCPEDLKHFKQLTTDGIVIMGRKTYQSIGHALPNRLNIVISKSVHNAADNSTMFFDDPWAAVKYCAILKTDKLFVIGGEAIYDWFLQNKLVHTLHITQINQRIADCDRRFKYPVTRVRLVEKRKLSDTADYFIISIINEEEQQCIDLIKTIMTYGQERQNRTGVAAKSLFGRQLRFNLRDNTFPLMTTRKMFFRGIFAELMLFIRGQTDNQILEDQKITVWRPNTTREFLDSKGLQHLPVGDIGSSYGFLFRYFGAQYKTCKDSYKGQGYDQLADVIKTIKTDPHSRRLIISLWDPNSLHNCPLPPCLYNYQFYVGNDNTLSCMMTQRSSDFVVAGGWNIGTGALLTYLIAKVCALRPAELIWNIGDIHIYSNLYDAAKQQMTLEGRPYPKLFIRQRDNIEDFEFEDLNLIGYNPHPSIAVVMNP